MPLWNESSNNIEGLSLWILRSRGRNRRDLISLPHLEPVLVPPVFATTG